MKQGHLFESVPRHKLESLTREELIEFNDAQSKVINQFQKRIEMLEALNEELGQKHFFVEDQFIILKNKLFGKSSERSPKNPDPEKNKNKFQKTRVLLPSQRYPDAQLIEREVELKELPTCECCQAEMLDSGMTEDSEFLTKIPEQYIVIRQKRHKYRCGKCHGDIKTAPNPPRIKPGSSYSDEMMVDVALTKYCDLIPIERYSAIAGRNGLESLPHQSLIEVTHYVADFVGAVYKKLEQEIKLEKILHADETPHRMLEGSEKSNWYLWGFSSKKTSYLEYHDTRSGDVAIEVLKASACEYLMSDKFSGYERTARETNIIRAENKLPLMKNIYCNAHARRKFKESANNFLEESEFYVEKYKNIYKIYDELKEKPPDDEALKLRAEIRKIFEEMRARAEAKLGEYPMKSSIRKAILYFLENYNEFALFIDNPELPIDNNQQERLLRNPVIGRKTWYGTHSERGAKTAAVLFSIVESCKLNNINPRKYFKNLVQDLHAGTAPYTPSEYKDLPQYQDSDVG